MSKNLGEGVITIRTNANQAMQGIRQVGQSVGQFGNLIGSAGRKMTLAGGLITGAVVAVAKTSVEEFASVESALTGAFSVLGLDKRLKKDEAAVKSITATVRELGEESKFEQLDLAKGVRQIGSAGFSDPKEIEGVLKIASDLAETMQIPLPKAVKISIDAINAMPKAVDNMGRRTEINMRAAVQSFANLQRAARIEGPELEQFVKKLSALTRTTKRGNAEAQDMLAIFGSAQDVFSNGRVAATAMAEAMAKMGKNMGGTKQDRETALKSIKALNTGMKGFDAIDPNKVGIVQALENIKKAGLTDISTQLFGTAGTRFVKIAGVGLDEGTFERIRKNMDASASLAKRAQLNLDTLTARFLLLKSKINSLRIAIGKALDEGGLRAYVDRLGAVVKKLSRWAEANPKIIVQIFKIATVIGLALTSLGILLTVVGGVIVTFGTVLALVGTILFVGIKVIGVIAVAVAGLLILSPLIITSLTVWMSLFALFIAGVIKGVRDFFSKNKEKILAFFNKIKALVIPLLIKIRDFFVNKFIPTIIKVRDLIAAFTEKFLKGFLQGFDQSRIDDFFQALKLLGDSIGKLWDTIMKALGLTDEFGTTMRDAETAGVDWGLAVSDVVEFLMDLGKWIVIVASAIIDFVADIIKFVKIMFAVRKHIKEIIKKIEDSVLDFLADMGDKISSFDDFMWNLGKQLGLAFLKGIKVAFIAIIEFIGKSIGFWIDLLEPAINSLEKVGFGKNLADRLKASVNAGVQALGGKNPNVVPDQASIDEAVPEDVGNVDIDTGKQVTINIDANSMSVNELAAKLEEISLGRSIQGV